MRVATSTDAADDVIAATAAEAGFAVARGPQEDVLRRFALACADLPDDALIVRLTADNVVPDPLLIRALLAAHGGDADTYAATDMPSNDLPYGVAAEAFSAKLLRAADAAAGPTEREHVTGWIIQHARLAPFAAPSFGARAAASRVTLDTLADYLFLCRLFGGVADPIGVPWDELCRRVEAIAVPPLVRFVLGTAQLGLDYGIANRSGLPSDEEAHALVAAALTAGVREFDTARGYGLAERRLGRALATHPAAHVTTKLDPLSDLAPDADTTSVERAVDASIYRSSYDLRQGPLDVVLLHRWAHHAAHDGRIWQRLLELRSRGVIAQLGASVSSPDEAFAALADPDLVQLQIPLNALDRRWEGVGAAALARGVAVHVRSSFLQGLLLTGAEKWPVIAGVAGDLMIARLSELARTLGRDGRDDLALAYVRAKPWVDGIVVGVDSRAQLDRDIALFARPPLDAAGVAAVEASFPDVPSSLLDPARWPVVR